MKDYETEEFPKDHGTEKLQGLIQGVAMTMAHRQGQYNHDDMFFYVNHATRLVDRFYDQCGHKIDWEDPEPVDWQDVERAYPGSMDDPFVW
jgi:hypothetical protein